MRKYLVIPGSNIHKMLYFINRGHTQEYQVAAMLHVAVGSYGKSIFDTITNYGLVTRIARDVVESITTRGKTVLAALDANNAINLANLEIDAARGKAATTASALTKSNIKPDTAIGYALIELANNPIWFSTMEITTASGMHPNDASDYLFRLEHNEFVEVKKRGVGNFWRITELGKTAAAELFPLIEHTILRRKNLKLMTEIKTFKKSGRLGSLYVLAQLMLDSTPNMTSQRTAVKYFNDNIHTIENIINIGYETARIQNQTDMWEYLAMVVKLVLDVSETFNIDINDDNLTAISTTAVMLSR